MLLVKRIDRMIMMHAMHEDRGLRIDQLRAFLAVAEHDHLTRAAAMLGASQPTVSHQLKALERALGVSLLERVGRGIKVSADGRALVPAISRALSAIRDVEELAAARAGLVAGDLTVAASNTVGVYRLPNWLSGFLTRYPSIEITIRMVNTRQAIALLREASVDCALVEGPEPRSDLDEMTIETDRLIVVAGADHPLARQEQLRPDDLRRHRYLAREIGSGTEALAADLLGHAYRSGPVLELGQVDAVRAGLLAGLGYAVISLAAVTEDLEAGRLCQLHLGRRRSLQRRFDALRRPSSHSPALDAFWAHLAMRSTTTSRRTAASSTLQRSSRATASSRRGVDDGQQRARGAHRGALLPPDGP